VRALNTRLTIQSRARYFGAHISQLEEKWMPSKRFVPLKRIIVLSTLMVLASAGDVTAQSKEVIEGARKEGQLVFYSGIPIPDAQAILSALEKKYPFIKSTFYRATGPALYPESKPSSVPALTHGTL
jgi:hypothetical protein